MFAKVAAFEFRQQLRQPLFWITSGVFFLLVFGFMASDRIRIGDSGNVHKNSPFVIAQTHLVMAFLFMFAATTFVAGAVIRDDETGFGPIIRTTPLAKFDYLYGRFAGAFAAAALSFLSVTVAMLLGNILPWVDPESLGPVRLGAYAYAYFVMAMPVALFSAALFFAVATAARSMAWTFLAVIGLVVVYVIAGIALGKPELEPLLARWDPFGQFAFDVATRYWTAADRNTMMPALTGALLVNRLFCLAMAAAFLALAFPLYRYRALAGRAARARPEAAEPIRTEGLAASAVRPAFDRRAALAQLVARTRFDMGQVLRSPVFWILLLLGLANASGALWTTTDDGRYGGALLPVTRIMIPALDGSFSIFAVIIAAYYAGELVWRDRDRRIHEMVDATPAPDWTFVLPKTLAVFLVLVATILAGILAAVIVQAAKGYFHFEIGKFLLWYLAPQAADLLILSILAIFLQAISPNKFAGWGLMALYIVALFAVPGMGFEHNLYIFGASNPVPLSDMNGQGQFWIGAWWQRLYWAAAALLLLVAAYALWRRGTESRMGPRLARAPARLKGPAGWAALAGLAVFVGSGGFIYLNTNVWNPYRTTKGDERWAADYERALMPFKTVPEPNVVQARLDVDLQPRRPFIETKGVYVIENRSGRPMGQAHVAFGRDVQVKALSLEGAHVARTFDRFNYRIFAFDRPMAPGERRTLTFDTVLAERGFRNARRNTRDLTGVVANGSFVNSFEIGPLFGLNELTLLTDRGKRRKYGLPAQLHPAPLGDQASRAWSYAGNIGWTTSDITLTTDADETPIAPGEKVSDVTFGGRRTARFVSTAPILDFFSIQSARYAVKTERYKGVDLSVYYDPQHAVNVERMLRALKVSLDYYQANFSPYQFRQTRVVEFPDYAQFAQSFAGTFPWSEGLGFIADYRDPKRIDIDTYVAAHEFAHQWWAHQMIGADQQGADMLTETLAQYSALRVMRRIYGPDLIRKFLNYELDSYLRARGGELATEQPLERDENQPYIHYRKGSVVMYRLADEIGEDRVNAALRAMLAKYAYRGDPYPTALDLVAALRAQAPADKQALITDLFEKITLYDLKATSAVARRRPDGQWDVRLTVVADKLYADGKGKETPAPMDETVNIGLFTARPEAKDFAAAKVIAFEKRPLHSGTQTLAFVVRRPPSFAGVDPYDELISRNADDHLVAVKPAPG